MNLASRQGVLLSPKPPTGKNSHKQATADEKRGERFPHNVEAEDLIRSGRMVESEKLIYCNAHDGER